MRFEAFPEFSLFDGLRQQLVLVDTLDPVDFSNHLFLEAYELCKFQPVLLEYGVAADVSKVLQPKVKSMLLEGCLVLDAVELLVERVAVEGTLVAELSGQGLRVLQNVVIVGSNGQGFYDFLPAK